MAKTMTTKELAEYLRVHEITICKHAAGGMIPGKRVGSVWRFEMAAIDSWVKRGGGSTPPSGKKQKRTSGNQTLKHGAAKKRKA